MTNFQRGYGEAEIGSDARPVNRGGMVTLSRGELWDITEAAKAKANRAFWRGSIFGVILATGAFIGSAAFGGDTADFGGTGCTLVPVSGQGHVAEVRCHNVHTSGPSADQGAMEVAGLMVGLQVLHFPGDDPDKFIALAPDGYFADPPVLTLNEWASGVILILPFVGS